LELVDDDEATQRGQHLLGDLRTQRDLGILEIEVGARRRGGDLSRERGLAALPWADEGRDGPSPHRARERREEVDALDGRSHASLKMLP
jgi:hypothetical protein